MKKILIIFIVLNLLVLSGSAFANSPVSGTAVLEVGSYGSGRIFVKTGTNGSTVNPAGCTGVTFGLSKDEENFEEMYAALLLALANSGTVNLQISSTSCLGQYPRIIYVGITPS